MNSYTMATMNFTCIYTPEPEVHRPEGEDVYNKLNHDAVVV